jgi:hypothetical protein
MTAGPKNHVVNVNQQAVSASHCIILVSVLAEELLVAHRSKNATEVHPHASLMKYTFMTFDLRAQ